MVCMCLMTFETRKSHYKYAPQLKCWLEKLSFDGELCFPTVGVFCNSYLEKNILCK